MNPTEKLLVERITKIRDAYTNPKSDLYALKSFALEVGVSEEEWADTLNLFQNQLEKGNSYLRHDNWDDAIEELAIAHQLDPVHDEVLYLLALAHERRWMQKKKAQDKKMGIEYGGLCSEVDPKMDKAALIITALKNAPLEPWIPPYIQRDLWRYAFWLLVLAGGFWVYRTYESDTRAGWTELTENESVVKPNAKGIHLERNQTVILQNLAFSTGSIQLPETARRELKQWADFLYAHKGLMIEIRGHTDNTGFPSANLILSEQRAKAVYDYFLSEGIAAKRLTYKGYGDTRPFTSNDSESNRNKNRRIELRGL
jgi:outer membrane protein OmpA-like peptidoglycan-associated protein